MSWLDLLFAHWPVDADVLRRLVPAALELDLHGGRGWIGVVPFRMACVGPRLFSALPESLPWNSPRAFPELNVRTYVRLGDKPGVFFFSLDATSALAVWGARTFYHLPYFRAAIRVEERGGWIEYRSRRADARTGPGEFRGRYRPTGKPLAASAGSFEEWLTERYCLYAVDGHGRARRGEIHHVRWPLEGAELELETSTLGAAHGLELVGRPVHLAFARRVDVVAWDLASCG